MYRVQLFGPSPLSSRSAFIKGIIVHISRSREVKEITFPIHFLKLFHLISVNLNAADESYLLPLAYVEFLWYFKHDSIDCTLLQSNEMLIKSTTCSGSLTGNWRGPVKISNTTNSPSTTHYTRKCSEWCFS